MQQMELVCWTRSQSRTPCLWRHCRLTGLNTHAVVDWRIGLTNRLVRVAKRGTRAAISDFIRYNELQFAISLAGRLALFEPSSSKLRTVFNFSASGLTALARFFFPLPRKTVFFHRKMLCIVLAVLSQISCFFVGWFDRR